MICERSASSTWLYQRRRVGIATTLTCLEKENITLTKQKEK